MGKRNKWWFRLLNERGGVGDAEGDGEEEDEPTQVTVDEDASSQKGTPQVTVKGKGEEASAGKKEEPKQRSPDEDRRWKALENQLAATRRVAEATQRELTTLRQQAAQRPPMQKGNDALPAGTSQDVVDKYDQLVLDGKWQEASRLIAREEAKNELDAREAAAAKTLRESSRKSTVERSKAEVASRYPKLDEFNGDPESTEAMLFNQAINELSAQDPEFLGNPYAPIAAMKRMEELAAHQGVRLSAAPVQRPTQPNTPIRRGSPPPRGSAAANTYTLTKEQKEFADKYLAHLPADQRYKHYASYAVKTEQTGSVEAN